jgi:hypothetical protein
VNGCLGGCLGRLLAGLVLAIVLVAAWRFGPDLVERFTDRGTADASMGSPEIADDAMERYASLVRGEHERIELSGLEVESILRYRLRDQFPPGVDDPSFEIRDGEVRVRLRVAMELLPRDP